MVLAELLSLDDGFTSTSTSSKQKLSGCCLFK